MVATAFWRCLYTAGHDVARLSTAAHGHLLQGTAVFLHETRPTTLHYELELEPDWTTRRARVHGFVAERDIDHHIERTPAGWLLDGVLDHSLAGLADLDLGFTPATNLQQLRRVDLAVGASASIPVAWLDVESTQLVALPQFYERRSELAYWYESPTAHYRALLEMNDDGFVARYPTLWESAPR